VEQAQAREQVPVLARVQGPVLVLARAPEPVLVLVLVLVPVQAVERRTTAEGYRRHHHRRQTR
jgi:hypothetical protein